MLEVTESLRPKSLITYPNYHKGEYFEEYFFRRFSDNFPKLILNDFQYIPIFWTNCYVNRSFGNKKYEIQRVLEKLDNNKKYFTISQHDDCVVEHLPKNTLIFSMGGNKVGQNVIPIPLVCSPIQCKNQKKDINISFVGSLTHNIRNKIYEKYKNDCDFVFVVKNWELNTDEKNVKNFIDIMSRSYYTLCPRGYGKSSFRMYESFQLNSVPIYVYDKPWIPWQDELDWSKLIISVPESKIDDIKFYTKNFDYHSMIEYKNKIYNDYFTFDGIYNNIIKKLRK
jgi:hypothetical protein